MNQAIVSGPLWGCYSAKTHGISTVLVGYFFIRGSTSYTQLWSGLREFISWSALRQIAPHTNCCTKPSMGSWLSKPMLSTKEHVAKDVLGELEASTRLLSRQPI